MFHTYISLNSFIEYVTQFFYMNQPLKVGFQTYCQTTNVYCVNNSLLKCKKYRYYLLRRRLKCLFHIVSIYIKNVLYCISCTKSERPCANKISVFRKNWTLSIVERFIEHNGSMKENADLVHFLVKCCL